MSYLKRLSAHGLLRVGSAMAIMQGVAILSGVTLSVLLARALGPDGYGRYLYVLTLAQFLAMPVLGGLPTLIARELAIYRARLDWARVRGIVRWSLWVVGITSVLMSLGASAIFLIMGSKISDSKFYLLSLPLVTALALMQIASAVIRGFEHPFSGNLPDGAIRPVALLIIVVLAKILGSLNPASAVAFHAFAAALAAAWAFLSWRRYCQVPYTGFLKPPPAYDSGVWIKCLWPLTLIAAAGMINSRFDIFLLGLFSNKSSIAIYGFAMQMAGLAAVSRTILFNIVGPRFARLWAVGATDEINSLIKSVNFINVSGALTAVAILYATGDAIVYRLVGSSYDNSVTLAVISSLSLVFTSAAGPAPLLLYMSGNEKIYMKLIVYMALINAILNAILIPFMGPMGSVIATLAAEVFFQLFAVSLVRNLLGINTAMWVRPISIRKRASSK